MTKLIQQLFVSFSFLLLLTACESLPFKKSTHNTKSETVQTQDSQEIATPKTVTPSSYDDIWARIRAGYGLPKTSHPLIDSQIKFFTDNKAYYYKITQESEPYLYYVVNELQAQGIPLELSLLPYIESAYNPTATSASNAGMWQIAASTGKVFGLKQTHNYDERKDVIRSTEIAIHLLKKLNKMFDGDWFLTIAAYNGGEGTVRKAIDKNKRLGKPTDFWSLPLNKTTQGYIPKLLALSKVVAEYERFNYKLYPIADKPYFVQIRPNRNINLNDAVRNVGINTTLFKKLNAGLSSLNTSSDTYPLLVPFTHADAFKLQLDSLPKHYSSSPNEHATKQKNKVESQYHTVKAGENLWVIAKKYNVTVNTLAKINNINIKTPLKLGQKIILSSTQ